MSRQSDTTVVIDTVVVVFILMIIGLTGWNTVRTAQLVNAIEKNRAHLCWTMTTMFGPPDDPQAACEEIRERALEVWQGLE